MKSGPFLTVKLLDHIIITIVFRYKVQRKKNCRLTRQYYIINNNLNYTLTVYYSNNKL